MYNAFLIEILIRLLKKDALQIAEGDRWSLKKNNKTLTEQELKDLFSEEAKLKSEITKQTFFYIDGVDVNIQIKQEIEKLNICGWFHEEYNTAANHSSNRNNLENLILNAKGKPTPLILIYKPPKIPTVSASTNLCSTNSSHTASTLPLDESPLDESPLDEYPLDESRKWTAAQRAGCLLIAVGVLIGIGALVGALFTGGTTLVGLEVAGKSITAGYTLCSTVPTAVGVCLLFSGNSSSRTADVSKDNAHMDNDKDQNNDAGIIVLRADQYEPPVSKKK